VATSLHRDEQDWAAHDRWIGWAVLVSLLLHAALFLPAGPFRRGPLTQAVGPPLQVRIEPQVIDADSREKEGLPASKELVAASPPDPVDAPEPGDLVPEELDYDIGAESRLAGVGSAPGDAAAGLDPPMAEAATDAAAHKARPVEPPLANDLVNDPVSSTEAVVATLAPAEETLLTRRLVREAHELLDSSALQSHLAFNERQRSFEAVLTRQPPVDATGIERVTAEIITEQGGERVQTSMQMKRLTFAHFTQLVDRWDESVQLHDDEIIGRFHSNSDIHLTYDHKIAPRLLGKVTTTRGILVNDEKGWRPRREIFAGGLETRSARIRLPDISLPVPHESASPNADVHLVGRDALIVFHANGDYDCLELESRAEARRRLAPDRPTYIIGGPDSELLVRGTVKGIVTVYSPERIVVQGDLTYAGGPGNGDAKVYLGLVSNGNVEIDRAEITGPGDLEIHAAVYARKRFIVRNAGARGRATLFIYGSLTAGTVSRTEPRYATRIEFDPRFERLRPPGFPHTDRYEIEAWDGRWRVAEAPL
jgi:hypothetical protein